MRKVNVLGKHFDFGVLHADFSGIMLAPTQAGTRQKQIVLLLEELVSNGDCCFLFNIIYTTASF